MLVLKHYTILNDFLKEIKKKFKFESIIFGKVFIMTSTEFLQRHNSIHQCIWQCSWHVKMCTVIQKHY